jgi:hypothetical protein
MNGKEEVEPTYWGGRVVYACPSSSWIAREVVEDGDWEKKFVKSGRGESQGVYTVGSEAVTS